MTGRSVSLNRIMILLPATALLVVGCGSNEERLFDACVAGDTRSIERLIDKGVDVNARSPFGEAPLSSFISLNAHRREQDSDFAATVERLIAAGADVNATNEIGITALHLAAGIGRNHRRVVELLLEAGAKANAISTLNRSTPLHAAAFPIPLTELQQQAWPESEQAEHYEVIRLLLEAGADVTLRDLRGRSPLDTAEESGSEKITQILRRHQEQGR